MLLSLLRDASGAPEDWARSIAERRDDQYSLGAYSAGKLLGVANYVACREPGYAELAVVVAHENTFEASVPRCYAGSAKSRRQTDCTIWLPSALGKPPHASGAFGDRLALLATP